jgi:hypothetical protein
VDRRFRSWLTLVLSLSALFVSHPAAAAPKDAAATKLADDAIQGDYLATNFAEAEKKLRKAIALCGGDACSPKVRARINRDLGVVLVAGLNRPEDGKAAFVEALKADPSIGLEKDLTTPDIDKVFQAAKGGGGSAPSAPSKPSAAAPAAGGDMTHTPPTEQAILTPVPLYAELPDGVTAVKVIARYKAFGTTEWKTIELRKVGNGYGAEVPCQEIGSTTGDLQYYLQATDAGGDVVSTSGSRNAPNKVAIKNELSGDAPHLPGKPPPSQCRDASDCPPGLPGCPAAKKSGGKGWGASCDKDSECSSGLACKNGSCETGDKSGVTESSAAKSCETSSDCESGERCNADKLCEGSGGSFAAKKIWLSLNVQQDIGVLGGQRDVCGPQSTVASTPDETKQYSCLEDNGDYVYSGVPDTAGGNAINGGFKVATTRFLVGLDFLASSNLTLGLRAGYGLNTNVPKDGLHLEGRLAFWIGHEPFKQKGVRPFFAVMAGYANMDTKIDVPIHETVTKTPTCLADAAKNGLDPATCYEPDKGRPQFQTLQVWRKNGPIFAGLGGGVMFPTGASGGVIVEVKFQGLFGNSGFAISPSVGYAFGL